MHVAINIYKVELLTPTRIRETQLSEAHALKFPFPYPRIEHSAARMGDVFLAGLGHR